MSIKKTSILALSVLLSYESFAAPTVLATTPRLGASSSVASTGRGKVTTSVSIGGGLNKLTSNRGQSSFTPNSAPTDKQNELIENFQKEIQNVRDAVAEELQAQNDKIRELESVIEEKDEKIAELEESIDEKIESKGFVTAESVTSEISTAKQEAVRQATNAAVKEVNSMGFAKTATVQSDILTAKNAAIAQAKTEAVAEVNGMGFAKTATINSDILNAKNAAIEQATTAALAEVESKGFATNVSVQNLKAEITTERNAALKSYATSAQLAEGIDAAKSEITTERNAALKSYATSADVSSAVTAAKTDAIAQAKTEAVEEVNSMGFAKTATIESDILTAKNAAIEQAKNEAVAAVNSMGFVTDTTVQNLKAEITTERNAALKSYATSADVSSAVTAAKAEITTARNTALKSYATSADVSSAVATLATKEELQNLKVGVDETAVADIVDEVLGTKKVISENTPAFQEVQQQVAAMPTTYAKSSALTSLDARVTKNTQDITTTQADVNNISDTIADTLLSDEDFKDGVLEGLSTELTGLPARVTQLDEVVKGLATQDDLNRVDGKFASYVEIDDVNNRFTELDGKFVKPADFGGLLKDADLSTNSKFSALSTTVSGLGNIYATNEALNSYLQKKDFDTSLSSSTALDGIFVKQEKFGDLLSANGKFKELNNTVSGLGTTYATKASLEELQNAKTLANLLGDTYVTPEKFDNVLSANGKFKELNNTVSSLGDTYATKVSLENLQNAKTLANYLGDTYVTPEKFDNVLSANGTFSALNTRVNGLGNTVSTLESSVTSLSSLVDELEQRVPVDDGDPDNEVVTPGN